MTVECTSGIAVVNRKRTKKAIRKTMALDALAAYYLAETSGRIIITGGPGTGKTVLALKILVDLATRRVNDQTLATGGGANPVPVIFDLPGCPDGESLPDWLASDLAQRFRLSKRITLRLVESGRILPILDSLDEIEAPAPPSVRTRSIVAKLNEYAMTTVGARLIVTCRNDGRAFAGLRKGLRGFDEVAIRPLSLGSIRAYVAALCTSEEVQAWNPLLRELRPTSTVYAVLRTPWRLAMAVTYCKSGRNLSALLPLESATQSQTGDGPTAAYLARVDNLLYETFVLTRARYYGRNPARVLSHLSQIAALVSGRVGGRPGSSSEIVLHDWWRHVDERRVGFYQTILAVVLIQQPFSVVGFFGGVGVSQSRPVPYALAFLVNFLLLVVLTGRAVGEKLAPLRLSLSWLRTSRGSILLASGILLGTLFGALAYASIGPAFGITVAAATGLVLAVGAMSVPRDRAIVEPPMSIMRRDLAANLAFGSAYGLFAGLYHSELLGATVGVCFGVAYLLAAVFSSATIKYFVAVGVSMSKFGTPLRLGRFLSWGCRAGLLRSSGIGYQFRHQGLLRYLLELTEGTHPSPTKRRRSAG